MDEVFIKVKGTILEEKYSDKTYVSLNDVLTWIEDLYYDVDSLEEQLSDMQDDIENNYTPNRIDPYEEYGVSEKDFY